MFKGLHFLLGQFEVGNITVWHLEVLLSRHLERQAFRLEHQKFAYLSRVS